MTPPTPRSLARIGSVVTLATTLTLWGQPALANAVPSPEETQETSAATDPSIPLARSLFARGLEAYEAGDYRGAVMHWSAAHDLMAGIPTMVPSRHVLGFDLGQAQVRAFDLDGDRSRLSNARVVLEDFVAWVERPQHRMDVGEREDRSRALELLARIDAQALPTAKTPAATKPRPPVSPAPPPSPAPDKPPGKGTGLLIGGGVALGGMVAGIATSAAMISRGARAEAQYNVATTPEQRDSAALAGTRANAGFVASTVGAAALGIAGVAMIAVGAHRRKRTISASAVLAPSMAAASVRFRF